MEPAGDAARAAASIARHSYGRLLAGLAARTRDVAAAEDALADAFAAALATWPKAGIPNNPEAWLVTVARRRQIDGGRRRVAGGLVHAELLAVAEIMAQAAPEESVMADDRLHLMFACAHPAIERSLHAPLILQTILGFDAATIASAFLVSPATMAQRLVRAKAKIKLAGIGFRLPEREELPARLDGVLQAIYAAFSRGWTDAAGRSELALEAIWLGGLVVELLPGAAEALGLQALMLHGEARRSARRGDDGGYVALSDQDPGRWRHDLIDEAEALLHRAGRLGAIGRFQLEAAIQSAHAARRHGGPTDWSAILLLYDALATMTASPVVGVNRAVALGALRGAAAGIAALDTLAETAGLATYQPYWAARAGLLAEAGRPAEAAPAYDRAIGLESDPAVRRYLQDRRAACL